jgi:hypothetical protein
LYISLSMLLLVPSHSLFIAARRADSTSFATQQHFAGCLL